MIISSVIAAVAPILFKTDAWHPLKEIKQTFLSTSNSGCNLKMLKRDKRHQLK
jgi:hypothetical protein